MNKEQLDSWMKKTYQLIHEHKEELSELDQVVGDGDHGVNMDRGFKAVVDGLAEWGEESVSATLQKIGTTLVSKVGGASGPLFGTAFMRMSIAFKEDDHAWRDGLEKATDGIAKRGKASPGDGTLLDVFDPVAKSVAEHGVDWSEMETVAKQGMEQTKEFVVKRGRGALLEERSVGHLDPGAVSSYYLFHALAIVMKGAET
ncbi:dihydroxyacetone kinase subunit DhaL [Shouchella patagoniensis]|uniref:dihydroxyacetone kinase subunit DhaL n=1 Tax=Shouchella patagoniensis TaxID=228576 RepID=UPI000995DDB2|nr:dihydroxyacetone kinase subunit DhaL [Shouchella patagoniensis]